MLKKVFSLKTGLVCAAILAYSCLFAANYPDVTFGTEEEIWPGLTFNTAAEPNEPWEFCILEVDMTNPGVELHPVTAGTRVATSEQAKGVDAVAAVNAGFFGMTSGISMSYIEIDGNIVWSNSGTYSTMGITGNHHEKCVITQVKSNNEPAVSTPEWENVINGLAGLSNLVTNGGVNVTLEGGGWENDRHPRTGAGYDEDANKLYFVTVDGRSTDSVGMTLAEFARFFIDLGCDAAMNYDGGGSTTCWVDGEVKNNPSDGSERTVNSIWAIVPAMIIDNTDTEFQSTGTWSQALTSQDYDRNSLTCSSTDTSAEAVWTATLPKTGSYKVYAWYAASSGHVTNAAYGIEHMLGSDIVTVNQTANGDQWILLGEYPFTDTQAAYVQLSNPAIAGKSVSADAVKFVYQSDSIQNSIVDNLDAGVSMTGAWTTGTYGEPWESNYHFAYTSTSSDKSFTWQATAPYTGDYKVSSYWIAGSNREPQSKFQITDKNGTHTVYADQTVNGEQWNELGTTFSYEKDDTMSITLFNDKTTGTVVVADAVKFSLVDAQPVVTAAENWDLLK